MRFESPGVLVVTNSGRSIVVSEVRYRGPRDVKGKTNQVLYSRKSDMFELYFYNKLEYLLELSQVSREPMIEAQRAVVRDFNRIHRGKPNV